ncbi:phospholipase D-like domain-containing protein [Manganibacter manganicus]|uniref:Phospholipase D n=1 Tax=Manganibacter manganicus TaxID=1873176 RepID=A0A1V8RTF6_9HYPH|nr:phosphatidylserine/phosphatidylglycerophosphate/cardiolipin synthase family protein [Pseudaminobacter manganicus]OQM76467.1 cardiolipin synthase [Pseudaminobacter manganicus]
MWTLLVAYWPHILATASVLIAAVAAAHATMTKDEVRAATGWVGVIVLSPFVGALVYAIAGINRIRRVSMATERSAAGHATIEHPRFDVPDDLVPSRFGYRFAALKSVGDRITHHALTSANTIEILETGDAAYAAMVAAIHDAQRSIILETYIFDRDPVGLRIADALIDAVRRGVSVRVLIDAVGARYSTPSIVGYLRDGHVPTDIFNGSIIMGLRLPYANLRTHRKILVADGVRAFVGGMNIRQGFTQEFSGADMAHDTHFCVEGPVVADIFSIAAEDWYFASGERLHGEAWDIEPETGGEPGSQMLMRALPSGPDASLEANHKMLMGAFSVARRSIRIRSPYFLPDRELISALTTAARRGVEIDIVVPSVNNLVLVDRAMTAQFDQVLRSYCRVWRAQGAFDHSKLLVVDSSWAFVGSSNLDPRSLRLNFEIDLEVLDAGFAGKIEARIEAALRTAVEVTLPELRARPFVTRLIDRILWLGSPYL